MVNKILIAFLFTCFGCAAQTQEKGHHFDHVRSVAVGDTVSARGTFDLLYACLNFKYQDGKRINMPVCEIPFGKDGGVNAEAITVELKVCSEKIIVSCIDPLPENAPPEVIKIRYSDGKALAPYDSVDVSITVKETPNAVKVFEVTGVSYPVLF
jgi:hypothetical protein